MKLKITDGKVKFMVVAGANKALNTMPAHEAEYLLKKGKVTKSDEFKKYPICVDGVFYFEGSFPKEKKELEEMVIEPIVETVLDEDTEEIKE